MFKCLLLQSWHSLSDPKLEQSLRVRLDFLAFTGFSIGSALPDETSFCKFRNKLIAQNKIEPLFNKIRGWHLTFKILGASPKDNIHLVDNLYMSLVRLFNAQKST